MRKRLLAIGGCLIASCATAQEPGADAAAAAQPQTQPRQNPCDAAPYRAFDFWLGAWEVFGIDGNKAGDNIISKEEGGCLLLEKWTSVQGGTGQSYNFYDPGQEKFRQLWVSSGAVIDYAGALNDDGAMVMEGDIHYHNGVSAPFRGTWTLRDDGSVKQYFQQFNAQTNEWGDWFTGIYKKQPTEE